MKPIDIIVRSAVSTLVLATLTQPAAAKAEQEQARAEDEIVVTAQGRAQQLQDVPIAINAISGATFEERVITNLESLIPQLPSVTLAESPFQKTVAIRGLGSTGGNIGYEQSAPLFVDGIFGGRGGQFVLPFFDLDRVEVVRGPQAIFFGKNATAGAISIVSARPTNTFYARISGGYDLHGAGNIAEAALSGPLFDNLRARISSHYSKRGDYLFDTGISRNVGGAREVGIRGSVEWDASPGISFYLKGEYADHKADRRFQLVCASSVIRQVTVAGASAECVEDQNISSGAVAGLFAAAFPPGSDFERNKSRNVTLRADITLGDHQLELTSGYSGYNSGNQDGLDRSLIGLATSTTQEDFDQFSHEVRLLSPIGGTVEYVAGLLYINAEHAVNQTVSQTVPLLAGDYVAVKQKSEAYSGFGKLTFNFAENARISVGARYTHENKDYGSAVSRYLNPAVISSLSYRAIPAGPAIVYLLDLDRSESSFDPSITGEWNVSEDMLLYASIARGTKAGGFEFFPRGLVPVSPTQLVTAEAVEYEEERALNYEAGFKSTFGNGIAELNGSFFYNDLKGLQNQILNIANLGFETFNAQRAHSAGFEIEGFVKPVDELKLGGSLSYLDAEYDNFEFPARGVNFTGNRLPFAPKWSGNAYLDGEFMLNSGLELSTHFQLNYTGSMSFDASNAVVDNGRPYATFDLRVALKVPANQLEFAVNVRNLFDRDDIRLFSNPSLLSLALPAANPRGVLLAEGRTIFLTAKKEF